MPLITPPSDFYSENVEKVGRQLFKSCPVQAVMQQDGKVNGTIYAIMKEWLEEVHGIESSVYSRID